MKELPKKPLFLGVDELRLSLAGVQNKAAICLIDNQIALAENNCPTTHILKPSSLHFEDIAENEYFCLSIAKRIGLIVPNIELRKIKDISFLLIERYDRHIKNENIERIHQEDFCQALGILSSNKYQHEGGPSFKNCFDLLKRTEHPANDRNQLAATLIFNYLMCNMDAHGKNFSLLYDINRGQLAPSYDIVCTCVYQNLTNKMSMKIGSKYDINDLRAEHWEAMCKDIQYRYLIMKKQINTQAELILQAMQIEKEILISSGQHTPIIDKIILVVTENIKRALARFKV